MEPCMRCHGTLAPGTTTQHYDTGDALLVIRGIPATVCSHCGEAWFDTGVMRTLEKITADFKQQNKGITIAWYKDAA